MPSYYRHSKVFRYIKSEMRRVNKVNVLSGIAAVEDASIDVITWTYLT